MKVSCIYPAFPTQTVPLNNQTLDEICFLIKLFQTVKANKMIKLECCHFATPNGSRHWGSKAANIKKNCEKQTCASWWNNKTPPIALPQGLHLTLITLLIQLPICRKYKETCWTAPWLHKQKILDWKYWQVIPRFLNKL